MKLLILLLFVSCSSKPKDSMTDEMSEFSETDLETLLSTATVTAIKELE